MQGAADACQISGGVSGEVSVVRGLEYGDGVVLFARLGQGVAEVFARCGGGQRPLPSGEEFHGVSQRTGI
jgi:hypothetical protein